MNILQIPAAVVPLKFVMQLESFLFFPCFFGLFNAFSNVFECHVTVSIISTSVEKVIESEVLQKGLRLLRSYGCAGVKKLEKVGLFISAISKGSYNAT